MYPFDNSIEAGILPLVEQFNRLGLTTYTSCEGHVGYGSYSKEKWSVYSFDTPWINFNSDFTHLEDSDFERIEEIVKNYNQISDLNWIFGGDGPFGSKHFLRPSFYIELIECASEIEKKYPVKSSLDISFPIELYSKRVCEIHVETKKLFEKKYGTRLETTIESDIENGLDIDHFKPVLDHKGRSFKLFGEDKIIVDVPSLGNLQDNALEFATYLKENY